MASGTVRRAISEVVFHLRDINPAMVKAWQEEFAPYSTTVKVRKRQRNTQYNVIDKENCDKIIPQLWVLIPYVHISKA